MLVWAVIYILHARLNLACQEAGRQPRIQRQCHWCLADRHYTGSSASQIQLDTNQRALGSDRDGAGYPFTIVV
ncbi:hypothetical protein [Candidatus Poriferisodalis sp.]|uniref:hypothetical protein n=1 Tax=Candidatus Poriferisodalis sp. TaxID=3101277 RepID=UPI003B52F518